MLGFELPSDRAPIIDRERAGNANAREIETMRERQVLVRVAIDSLT
jgi:hypothetical protein